ncbi:MAG: ferritin-like domain-containing protein [Candidatus Dadabacteria bacterium]|nr:MAG: ferritin-like domain-containing protein [Candidatus Dadabacteria bacterium]
MYTNHSESFPISFEASYAWEYRSHEEGLRNLYEKSKAAQWNAATDIDWSIDVDPEAENTPDEIIPFYGSKYWNKLSEAEIRRFRHAGQAWSLSQFMHGEQGALMVAAQLVNAVPNIDSKFYAAQQAADEARHVEAYQIYLDTKLEKQYPCHPELRTLLDQILAAREWDIKYLGMQILVEGLALAAFGMQNQVTREPLIKDITSRIMQDEARHVAFGVLSLRDWYAEMSDAELAVREEFATEACWLMRDRLYPKVVWEEFGFPVKEMIEISDKSEMQRQFRTMLFSKIVPNVKRLGLLNDRLRAQFAKLGILGFEDHEPSA